MVKGPAEQPGHYYSCLDGDYLKKNQILSQDISLCITLYIDDFEICNPLGTSKKKQEVKGMQLGLLIAYEGNEWGPIPDNIFNIAVVVEETIVLQRQWNTHLSSYKE